MKQSNQTLVLTTAIGISIVAGAQIANHIIHLSDITHGLLTGVGLGIMIIGFTAIKLKQVS